jgi:hypothetical protein
VTLVFPSGRLTVGRLLSRIASSRWQAWRHATFGPTINITLATDGSSVDIEPVALLPDAAFWRTFRIRRPSS